MACPTLTFLNRRENARALTTIPKGKGPRKNSTCSPQPPCEGWGCRARQGHPPWSHPCSTSRRPVLFSRSLVQIALPRWLPGADLAPGDDADPLAGGGERHASVRSAAARRAPGNGVPLVGEEPAPSASPRFVPVEVAPPRRAGAWRASPRRGHVGPLPRLC